MEEKKNRIYKTLMLVILTAFITFMGTVFWMYSKWGEDRNFNISDISDLQNTKGSDTYSNLEKNLKKIKNTIDNLYLWNNEIDEAELEKGAIQGYVAGLGDEYTEYIPADEMKEYKENITGNFVGIGIYMINDEEAGRVVVYYPIPGSPAEKAGIKAGDYIISVDGKEYFSSDFKDISKYIKGEEKTNVKIEIERNGERLNFEITREKINTNPITIKNMDSNIGYLKLPSFDQNTSVDFEEKVKELQSNGMQKLIIDLRNNGGGIVDEATKIADMLLEKEKIIMSTKDNKKKSKETKSKDNPTYTMPVVVLVNKNSASASEILVGSLKENERAKIVGTKTYGKGVIQTLLSLNDGSGLKITTEEYYTPNGNSIHKVGIEPDEKVELPKNVDSKYSVNEEEDTQLQKAIELLK